MCLGCREVCGKINVRMLSMCLFWLRSLAISGSGWRPAALWTLARAPIVQLAEVGLLYPLRVGRALSPTSLLGGDQRLLQTARSSSLRIVALLADKELGQWRLVAL